MRVFTVTHSGSDVVVRVRGDFDRASAARLHRVVTDYLEGGGSLADRVVDLQATTRCQTTALRSLEGLVGAGVRLRTGPRRRRSEPAVGGPRASQATR